MQKKYFKCYFCKIGNSYLVPSEEKGKECRCCQAYNYFYTNNHSNYNHEKKNNNKNYNNNHNRKNNFNSNNNQNKNNNRYDKKRKNNHYNHQNISNNNNYIGNQDSSNNDYFSRTNNNFYHIPNVSHNDNISYINFSNNTSFGQNNNRRNDGQISALNRTIYNILRNNFRNNINQINNDSKEKIKQDNNNIIKYSWLKKEKLTQEIIKEKKNSYECTICLEKLNINDDINILKCGHIFHYKCIENVVDHHLSRCPNCRCDLKTGEKQPNNQNINDDIFMGHRIFEVFPIDDDDDFGAEYFI